MRNVDYPPIWQISPEVKDTARVVEGLLRPTLVRQYCGGNERQYLDATVPFRERQLPSLLSIASPHNLRRKIVLDLGCGSRYARDADTYTSFEPWLSRALHALDIHVIGVDIANLDGEYFDHHSIDLFLPDSLGFIPDESIGMVYAIGLFDSPALKENYGHDAGRQLRDHILPQLERIVKPDGIFMYERTGTQMLKSA
ncbi:class I SAM-dependent methyltransferase [Candidatus Woesearchaeota archaeon]|nr:class I SAM-dependent methyltransferase [Candidatus Woesearchaeota archaeon]